MKRKKLFIITMMLFSLSVAWAENDQVGEPIVMIEKVVNPSGTLGEPHKSSNETLCIYQNGNTFYFGESFSGCLVTLLSTNLVVYNDIVDSDGIVIIPESFSGAFELCITVGSQVFSAEIVL